MNTNSISTSFKAFAFGIGATLAVALSMTHLQAERERTASIVKLDPVVISFTRTPKANIEKLPTVYITGSRTVARGDMHLASSRASCDIKLC